MFLNQQDESFIKFNLYYRPDRLQPLIDLKDYQPTFIPDTNLMNNRYAMVNNFDPLQPVEFTEFWDWLQPLSMDEQISMLTMIGTQKYIDLVPEESTFLREKILPGRELVQWYSCAQEEDVDQRLDRLLQLETSSSDSRCLLVGGNTSKIIESKLDENQPQYLDFEFMDTDQINIQYSSNSEGWIVIRQNYFPGWKVVLDGSQTVPIEKVDYLFQGFYVPAGEHGIIVKYSPNSFFIGMILSIISSVLLIGLISYPLYRKLSKKPLL